MRALLSKFRLLVVGAAALGLGGLVAVLSSSVQIASGSPSLPSSATPIQHLVVIFDENVSFDHYFATYPNATNADGTAFTPAAGTPVPNNLQSANLLPPNVNPNSTQPSRLPSSDVIPCGNDHGYTGEQSAFDNGLMNHFGSCAMGYYDGNTVTGLWNLAQHFTMSDNFYGTTFGPSTPGAINLISGNTHGAVTNDLAHGAAGDSIIADPNPTGDDCGGGNIGDLMNAAGVSWGWFQGGFAPTSTSGGIATCGDSHKNAGGATVADYSAHHEPFQYYASTANPHHLPPSSTAMIGQTDQANHQYDLKDFDLALANGNMPQVSFLKAAAFEDGHPGNSGPIDEQRWIARVVDEVEASPDWANTAIIITYDDSDGWYDHAFIAPQQGSRDASNDTLNGPGVCGALPAPGDYADRCGPGPRLPLIIVSPWVTPNTIHHTQREQTSITKFIEDNWGLGRIGDQSFDQRAATLNSMFDFNVGDPRAPAVFLNPSNGAVLPTAPTGAEASPDAPPPTIVTTTTPTTTPTTTTTPTPPPPLPKLKSLSAKRHGKKVSITLKFTGVTTSAGKITVKLTLAKGKTTIAKGSGTVRSGKVALTLKAERPVKKGRYKLTVSVSQAGRTAKLSRTVKLK
jgi:phospholipase C